jgi:hypothetical protein
MVQVLKGLAAIAVSLCILAGCALDPAVKPWWTLREANFLQLQPGKMNKAEVRTALGRALAEVAFPRQGEEVWDYRYPDGAMVMLAWVYFDARGVYKFYTSQPDPAFIYAEGN